MTRAYALRRRAMMSLVPALVPWPFAASAASRASRRQLVEALLPNITAARKVGERYLAQTPEERCTLRLTEALFGGALHHPPAADALPHLRRIIEARRHQDFTRGDTVILDGWLLARTEARLCALAAMA
jgi:hypothetical protein